MNHLSLFSGIGGFDLAAEWMGWTNIAHVEKNEFCRKILKQHFPNAKSYEDITEFDGTKYSGAIDVISGGFPCQPFSAAGDQKGESDDRHLWPEMLRVIREIKPQFVVGENVPGIVSMDNGEPFERILSSLENEGYEVQAFIIPSVAVSAWHKRERVWIIAHAIGNRLQRGELENTKETSRGFTTGFPSWTSSQFSTKDQLSKSCIIRTNDGIPDRMDRTKALGNAIVPQVAYQIFKLIKNYHHAKGKY